MLLWYEGGAILEAKLPLLATYLGHKDIESTQKYLHLTEELLIPITSRYQAQFGHLINDGGAR
jgi:site-specific recombinase XerD